MVFRAGGVGTAADILSRTRARPTHRQPRVTDNAARVGGFARPRLAVDGALHRVPERAMLRAAVSSIRRASRISAGERSVMSQDRLAVIAERLVAARRAGTRVTLAGGDAPADYREGFAIQDQVVAALASPVIGWKVMA